MQGGEQPGGAWDLRDEGEDQKDEEDELGRLMGSALRRSTFVFTEFRLCPASADQPQSLE